MNARLRHKKSSGVNPPSSSTSNLLPSSSNSVSAKSELSRWIKLVLTVLSVIFGLSLFFFLGAARERAKLNNSYNLTNNLTNNLTDSAIGNVREKKMELKMHWRGEEITLNKYSDPDGDVCTILPDCFKSNYFKPDPIRYPDNPLQPCHRTLKSILNAFDSGFYFDGPRVVGFVSSELMYQDGFVSINVYNVCVRREERGKGIAKSMMAELIKALTAKYVPSGMKTYIGLDVDFETESAVAAFAMYAKMGFNRWWEPCQSIAYFDYQVLERQMSLANPSSPSSTSSPSPAFLFPMSQLILRRKESLQKQIHLGRKNSVLTHFCMVMLLGADDFGTIGKEIQEVIKTALNK